METSIQVKERPILFAGAMVRAILSGQKTQTRRAVKLDHLIPKRMQDEASTVESFFNANPVWTQQGFIEASNLCPYGQPGDRLYVRETWANLTAEVEGQPTGREDGDTWGPTWVYKANTGDEQGMADCGMKWKPSIHMPRRASRILLEIVSVRVERLQDMSEADAVAEGLKICPNMNGRPGSTGYVFPDCHYDKAGLCHSMAVTAFSQGWDSIYGESETQAWQANPWVWVIEFRRINP
ncbi:hypothetical protein LJ737_20930 [Hymenobacter sp. 15J16-1T3B]|uniref:hypothetical protein n=1 Tax=Hymenobacter sp. 15J16-1T3B TaxID=2886941 RepID=UPI001D0F68AF|nr:hypothetical protein [Hymenobacter sp. 15J16-1T3B]MCC3159719.1 hypothetical protein [Hymenobacter sp. 15J16-1T3B]